jgi:hypothetical protein
LPIGVAQTSSRPAPLVPRALRPEAIKRPDP